MSSGARRPFGPSRRATVVSVAVLALLLYGFVVVLTVPLSGGWLQSAGWAALSVVVMPLFNKRLRALLFDHLADASTSSRRARRRRAIAAASRAPQAPVVAAAQDPGAAAPQAPGAAAAARPLRPAAAEPQALRAPPAGAPPAPGAGAGVPATGAGAPTARRGLVDLPATMAAVAAALTATLPAGCAVSADAVQAVAWNSVATKRCALGGPAGASPDEPAARLSLAVTQLLTFTAGFVRDHGMTSWPPAELAAHAVVDVGGSSLRAWYELERRPVLVLAEVPVVLVGAQGPARGWSSQPPG